MATAHTEFLTVLVGPTCPTCEADDLSWGAPLGAPCQDRCRQCGTEYRRYTAPSDDDDPPEPACAGCGVHHDPGEPGTAYCEDCGPSDCVFCGVTTLRWMLSDNLACGMCEEGEAA